MRWWMLSVQRGRNNSACFLLNLMEMLGTNEALGIHLIDLFGSGGAGGEPAVFGADFQPSDGSSVGGCVGKFGDDGFTGEGLGADIFWDECGELLFFFAGGRRIDPFIVGGSMAVRHGGVVESRILLGYGANFSGEEGENNAVFIGAPNGAIVPKKRGPCGFFTSKGGGAFEEPVDKPFKADGDFLKVAV